MRTVDLTYADLSNPNPKAIFKKMSAVTPADRPTWWKKQEELHGTFAALEAQLRAEAHQNHALWIPTAEGSLLLTKEVERDMQELLDLDLETEDLELD